MALKSICIDTMKFDISYEIVNPSAKKDIVILHGWGANKEIMKNNFSNTLKEFRHIYIDMPGFGKSSNDYVLDVKSYTKIMDEFLTVLGVSKLAIAGHSFGGKVATLLKPENLILLSSAGILEPKPFSVQLKIKLSKIFNALGLKNITKAFRSKDVDAMSEVMYKTFKNVVNENLEEDFKNYQGQALIFWGKSDTATTLRAGQKIDSLIQNSHFKAYDGDHYFFCHHAKDIGKRIENAIL